MIRNRLLHHEKKVRSKVEKLIVLLHQQVGCMCLTQPNSSVAAIMQVNPTLPISFRILRTTSTPQKPHEIALFR